MKNADMPAYPNGRDLSERGFTKRERACIDLRIPESGDTELDALINKARHQEFAAMAMQSLLTHHGDGQSQESTAREAVEAAGILLVRWRNDHERRAED